MKWISPIFGLLVIGCSKPTPPPAPTMLVFTWQSTKSSPGIMLGNYILTDINTGRVVGTPLKGQISYTLTPLPTPGMRTYSLVITGTDSDGNLVQSPPATVTIQVP